MNKAIELLRRVFTLQEEQEQQGGIEFIIDPIEPADLPCGCTPEVPKLEANTTTPVFNRELTEAITRGANPEAKIRFDYPGYPAHVEDFGRVWIYNVSELSYELNSSTLKCVKVPACPEDEEYVTVTSLPVALKIPVFRPELNEIEFVTQDGKRVAQDLINPDNLGLDQDTEQPYALAVGNNFNQRGVFWSTNNPPLKRELKAAHKRLKKYYENIIDIANIERMTAAAKRLNIPVEVVKAADKYVQD